jgi:hypothetical protein
MKWYADMEPWFVLYERGGAVNLVTGPWLLGSGSLAAFRSRKCSSHHSVALGGPECLAGLGDSIKWAAVLFERGHDKQRARPSIPLAPVPGAQARRRSVRGSGSCCHRQLLVRACPAAARQATDLSVAQAVVAEGQGLAGDSDLRDLASAALVIRSNCSRSGPPLVVHFCAASTSAQRSALTGDMPEACFAVRASNGRCDPCPRAEVPQRHWGREEHQRHRIRSYYQV